MIDDAWTRATLEPNRQLFDGPMCRLEGWVISDDGSRVDVSLSHTSYRLFWGTNIMHPELAAQHGAKVMANPIGVSPALESSDGYLLFGRRNAMVAYYPSRVHPFAGCLEPGDGGGAPADEKGTLINSGDMMSVPFSSASSSAAPDPFAAIFRELDEELRLAETDIELMRLTGVVEDIRLQQPELIFRVKCRLPRAQIEAQVERQEHAGSVAVAARPDTVGAALLDAAMTPVAVAALLLWGRGAFGEKWYGEAARGLVE
jgi:hypothetical protein